MMQIKKTGIILIVLFFSLNAIANRQDFEQKMKESYRFYEAGHYDKALEIYNSMANTAYESPELFYNMGNCHYRLNHVGLSIYWYKKAELLDPSDKDIKYNLELANLRVKNLPPVMPESAVVTAYKEIVFALPLRLWGIFGILFFTGFLGLLFWNIRSRSSRRKKWAFIFAIISLFFSVSSVLFTNAQYQRIKTNDKAVVISEQSILKSAPGQGGKDLFPVYEGFFLKIENSSDNMFEIKLTDGRKGWISKNDIKIL